MASIIVISGANEGDYYPLGQRTNVIGRSETVPIQIIDPKVSRKHLQIRFDKDAGQYIAVDMQSKHGVSINGTRLGDEEILSDNDCITVGQTNVLFTLEDFKDRENALLHYKKVGEKIHPTISINDTIPRNQ